MPPFTAPRSAVRVQKTRASFWWPAVWGLCWSMCALSVWTISANTEVPVASEKTIASAVMKAFMAGLRCCLHDRSNDVTIDALAEIEREAFHTIPPLAPPIWRSGMSTIGIVPVSRWRATVAGSAFVTMMSGCRLTNSFASARVRLRSSPAQRRSIRALELTVQPKPANACVNAENSVFALGSFSSPPDEHADAPYALPLLRPCHYQPRRRAPEPCDELPSLH